MDLCLSLDACITQMFFIHSFEEVELGVLVAPWPLIVLWLFASLCTMLLFSLMPSSATLGQQSCYGVSWLCSLCLSSSKGYLSATPMSYVMHTAFIRMPWGLSVLTPVSIDLWSANCDLLHCIRCLDPFGFLHSNPPGSIGHCFPGREIQNSQYLLLSYLWLWFTDLESICNQ